MKKTLQLFSLVTLIVMLTFVSGCKKNNNNNSSNNNVKVLSSSFTITSWSWSSPNYYSNLSVPELTSDNINTAAVMVYFSTGSNWIAIPFTQYNSPYNYYMGFNTGVGKVQVTWTYDSSLSSGDNPNTYYSATVKCKVVVIPPAKISANPDLNLKDYKAVKERFNLKD